MMKQEGMSNTPDINALLMDIAARASFLFERRGRAFTPAAEPDETILQAGREAWAKALDVYDSQAALEKYLRWLQLEPADISRMLSPVQLAEGMQLPAWAQMLGEVLQLLPFEPDPPPARHAADRLARADDIPFEAFFQPFIQVFRRHVSGCPGWQRLDAPAQFAVEEALLAQLSRTAVETLYAGFNALRLRQPFGDLLITAARAGKTPETRLYRNFINDLLGGGMAPFFRTYPVLARLSGTTLQLFCGTFTEFLQRLEEDLPELECLFGVSPKAKVTHLRPALSDSHAGGQRVIGLTFDGKQSIIYKPKRMGMEAAYNRLLDWLNQRGVPLDLKALKVLARPTHGWVEFADHATCRDREAVRRYYQRMGMLLCLVYALEGTDCHIENVVASGEYPVLIDSETLFHHRVPEKVSAEVAASAIYQTEQLFSHSVARSGMLPGWSFGKDHKIAYDISGLGGEAGQALPFRRQKWEFINSDAMQLSYESGTLKPEANIPLVDGIPVSLADHAPAVSDGFTKMYHYLMERRVDLLQEGSPLYAFGGQQARFVFRNTLVYAQLLEHAAQPNYLRDGLAYSLYLERLATAFLQLEEKPLFLDMLHAERQAMYRGDIPFFCADVKSDALNLDPACALASIPHYFTAPSFDNVRQRLKCLSIEDLEEQLYVVQLALHTRLAAQEHSQVVSGLEVLSASASAPLMALDEVRSRECLGGAALSLARLTLAQAKRGKDGSAAWIGPIYLMETRRYQLGLLPHNLYNGNGGVAVFLAAACHPLFSGWLDASERAALRDLCLGALQAGRSLLAQDSFESALTALGLGGGDGVGSIIYSLASCGQLLEEEPLLREAQAAACRLTCAQAAADEKLDVIFGLGGALLSLLSVYEKTGDAAVLERAIWCGQLLLQKRSPTASGYRAWKTIGAEPLSGFSHGAAGIICALLRLYRASGDETLRAAAEEALAYENTLFDPLVKNWRDLRPEVMSEDASAAVFQIAWCHGAPGIGLSRLAGLPALDTPQVRQDIEHALDSTRHMLKHLAITEDHLCCGNMGRIDLFAAASRFLQRPELLREARQYALQVVENAAKKDYAFAAGMPRGLYTASFFQGASGIGYELLRLLQPEHLPDVLLWE